MKIEIKLTKEQATMLETMLNIGKSNIENTCVSPSMIYDTEKVYEKIINQIKNQEEE